MTGHDPMALLGEPLPAGAPWEALAQQARALAELADHYAATPPAELAPGDSSDPLTDLDARALAIRSAVAACRRHTWQALVGDGVKMAEVGRRWGVTRAAVTNALKNPGRSR